MDKSNLPNKSADRNKIAEETNGLSRRKWLERVSVPALATIGASFIGSRAVAETKKEKDLPADNMLGARTYNVREFGAKGDGSTLDTLAVQAAIDACNRDNGGTVLIPAGDFIVGTLELKSNVTLHLSTKGRLLGSKRREDYQNGKGIPSGNGNVVFLFAVNAENLTIEGRGTVDGNGAAFFNGKGDNTGPGQDSSQGNFDRPHLAIFYKCNNMVLRDTFFTNSAYHCFRILGCKQVNIDGVRIYNRVNKNNDGFHFNNSQYVHISNCDVQCQDDACALFGSNQFVTVTNCSFSTRWSIFRFGSGEAQNIAVSNCLIYDTYGCPIKIGAGGRSYIENLTFSNIIMKNVTGPIGIGFSGGNRNANNNNNNNNAANNTPPPKVFVRNLVFNGIRATVIREPINHPDIPFDVKINAGEQFSCIALNAMGDNYIENVSFTDVHVTYVGGGTLEHAKKKVPETSAEYFGVWKEEPTGPPAYGMYARNVKGLTLQNVRFDVQNPDLRPAIVFDNVQDALVNGLSAEGNPNAESLLRFVGVQDVLLTASRVLTPAAVFMRVEGATSQGITIDGGDLRKATKPLSLENGVGKQVVKLRV